MPMRVAAALCTALLLGGCSLPRISDLFSFPDNSDAAAAAASEPRQVVSAAPVAPPGAPDPYCAAVAQQDAQEGGFDAATQQRMIQRGYRQCMALYRAP